MALTLEWHLSSSRPATEPNSISSIVQDKCKSTRPCLHSPLTHAAPLPLPVHSEGPLTPTFPDVFPGLMEHSWMHQVPTPCKSGGLCRHLHKWRQEASPGVHYTLPQPKRWAQPKNLETPHDIWNNLPLTWIDIAAATRLIVFFLEQSWKSLKGQ